MCNVTIATGEIKEQYKILAVFATQGFDRAILPMPEREMSERENMMYKIQTEPKLASFQRAYDEALGKLVSACEQKGGDAVINIGMQVSQEMMSAIYSARDDQYPAYSVFLQGTIVKLT